MARADVARAVFIETLRMMSIAAMTLIPAALVCGLVMLLAWRPWRRPVVAVRGEWGAPLGLGAAMMTAYIAAFIAMKEPLPDWLPRDRWQWITVMTLAATCFGLINAGWRPIGWEVLFLCAVASFCTAWLVQPTPPVEYPIAHKVMVGALAFALAATLEPVARRRTGTAVPMSLAIVFAGAAVLFVQSGFARLALLGAAVAAALAVIALLAWWNGSVGVRNGGGLWLGVMLAALIGIGADTGYNTGEKPIACYALIAIAPLVLWVSELKWAQQLRPATGAMVRIALVCGPVIVALALMWPLTLPPM